MDGEQKGLFVRILEIATGITGVTAVLVFASTIGVNAYLAYQPSALEAQVINVTLPPSPIYIDPPEQSPDSNAVVSSELPQPSLVYFSQ